MAILKKIQFNNTLSIEDMMYLSRLLNTNLSLNNCFDLLGNSRNMKIFEKIKTRLQKGELIENIIIEYTPVEIRSYLDALLSSLSFNIALKLSLDFYEKQNENKNSLVNAILYPSILLFLTITALYLFDLYGLDSLFSLMGSFSNDINIYHNIRVLFRIVITVIYYGFLISVLIIIYYRQPKRITLLYIFISRYFSNSLFNIYYCEQFMSLLLICVDYGYKTKESLQLLKKMKSKPIVAFLAFHLDDYLLKGESLKEAVKQKYYDSSLSRYIKLANYTNDFSNIINSYLLITREKIKRKMKQFALTIQLTTYMIIGAIIIFIYQLLFMPMQAITMY